MDEAVDKEMVAEAWETPPPATMPTTLLASPVLHLDGFDGPMDLLLDLAERQKIDFGRMSIIDLAVQFVAALERHGAQVPLERRADWLVLAPKDRFDAGASLPSGYALPSPSPRVTLIAAQSILFVAAHSQTQLPCKSCRGQQ